MNTKTKATVPAINQPWPEQGGIYIGSRLINGAVHHIVIADGGTTHDREHHAETAKATRRARLQTPELF